MPPRPPLRFLVALLGVLALIVGSAEAHRFFWNGGSDDLDGAYPIDLSRLSSFIVGELEADEVDFYRVEAPPHSPQAFALLAPLACPAFAPELWVVAPELSQSEPAPFDIPEGYVALRMQGAWQPYRDYLLNARFGPHVRAALEDGTYYLAVYAGATGGYYINLRVGTDGFGGTTEGFDALARFTRCGGDE